MAKKATVPPKKSAVSKIQNASLVQMVIYLIKSPKRMETAIALSFGTLLGGIFPVTSYVIAHSTLPRDWNAGEYGAAFGDLIILIAGLVVSLFNVQSVVREMTHDKGKKPWAYAILLEGAAMMLSGGKVETVVGSVALMSIVLCNTIRMTYKALLNRRD